MAGNNNNLGLEAREFAREFVMRFLLYICSFLFYFILFYSCLGDSAVVHSRWCYAYDAPLILSPSM